MERMAGESQRSVTGGRTRNRAGDGRKQRSVIGGRARIARLTGDSEERKKVMKRNSIGARILSGILAGVMALTMAPQTAITSLAAAPTEDNAALGNAIAFELEEADGSEATEEVVFEEEAADESAVTFDAADPAAEEIVSFDEEAVVDEPIAAEEDTFDLVADTRVYMTALGASHNGVVAFADYGETPSSHDYRILAQPAADGGEAGPEVNFSTDADYDFVFFVAVSNNNEAGKGKGMIVKEAAIESLSYGDWRSAVSGNDATWKATSVAGTASDYTVERLSKAEAAALEIPGENIKNNQVAKVTIKKSFLKNAYDSYTSTLSGNTKRVPQLDATKSLDAPITLKLATTTDAEFTIKASDITASDGYVTATQDKTIRVNDVNMSSNIVALRSGKTFADLKAIKVCRISDNEAGTVQFSYNATTVDGLTFGTSGSSPVWATLNAAKTELTIGINHAVVETAYDLEQRVAYYLDFSKDAEKTVTVTLSDEAAKYVTMSINNVTLNATNKSTTVKADEEGGYDYELTGNREFGDNELHRAIVTTDFEKSFKLGAKQNAGTAATVSFNGDVAGDHELADSLVFGTLSANYGYDVLVDVKTMEQIKVGAGSSANVEFYDTSKDGESAKITSAKNGSVKTAGAFSFVAAAKDGYIVNSVQAQQADGTKNTLTAVNGVYTVENVTDILYLFATTTQDTALSNIKNIRMADAVDDGDIMDAKTLQGSEISKNSVYTVVNGGDFYFYAKPARSQELLDEVPYTMGTAGDQKTGKATFVSGSVLDSSVKGGLYKISNITGDVVIGATTLSYNTIEIIGGGAVEATKTWREHKDGSNKYYVISGNSVTFTAKDNGDVKVEKVEVTDGKTYTSTAAAGGFNVIAHDDVEVHVYTKQNAPAGYTLRVTKGTGTTESTNDVENLLLVSGNGFAETTKISLKVGDTIGFSGNEVYVPNASTGKGELLTKESISEWKIDDFKIATRTVSMNDESGSGNVMTGKRVTTDATRGKLTATLLVDNEATLSYNTLVYQSEIPVDVYPTYQNLTIKVMPEAISAGDSDANRALVKLQGDDGRIATGALSDVAVGGDVVKSIVWNLPGMAEGTVTPDYSFKDGGSNKVNTVSFNGATNAYVYGYKAVENGAEVTAAIYSEAAPEKRDETTLLGTATGKVYIVEDNEYFVIPKVVVQSGVGKTYTAWTGDYISGNGIGLETKGDLKTATVTLDVYQILDKDEHPVINNQEDLDTALKAQRIKLVNDQADYSDIKAATFSGNGEYDNLLTSAELAKYVTISDLKDVKDGTFTVTAKSILKNAGMDPYTLGIRFNIKVNGVPVQHYAGLYSAEDNDEDVLHFAVKDYINPVKVAFTTSGNQFSSTVSLNGSDTAIYLNDKGEVVADPDAAKVIYNPLKKDSYYPETDKYEYSEIMTPETVWKTEMKFTRGKVLTLPTQEQLDTTNGDPLAKLVGWRWVDRSGNRGGVNPGEKLTLSDDMVIAAAWAPKVVLYAGDSLSANLMNGNLAGADGKTDTPVTEVANSGEIPVTVRYYVPKGMKADGGMSFNAVYASNAATLSWWDGAAAAGPSYALENETTLTGSTIKANADAAITSGMNMKSRNLKADFTAEGASWTLIGAPLTGREVEVVNAAITEVGATSGVSGSLNEVPIYENQVNKTLQAFIWNAENASNNLKSDYSFAWTVTGTSIAIDGDADDDIVTIVPKSQGASTLKFTAKDANGLTTTAQCTITVKAAKYEIVFYNESKTAPLTSIRAIGASNNAATFKAYAYDREAAAEEQVPIAGEWSYNKAASGVDKYVNDIIPTTGKVAEPVYNIHTDGDKQLGQGTAMLTFSYNNVVYGKTLGVETYYQVNLKGSADKVDGTNQTFVTKNDERILDADATANIAKDVAKTPVSIEVTKENAKTVADANDPEKTVTVYELNLSSYKAVQQKGLEVDLGQTFVAWSTNDTINGAAVVNDSKYNKVNGKGVANRYVDTLTTLSGNFKNAGVYTLEADFEATKVTGVTGLSETYTLENATGKNTYVQLEVRTTPVASTHSIKAIPDKAGFYVISGNKADKTGWINNSKYTIQAEATPVGNVETIFTTDGSGATRKNYLTLGMVEDKAGKATFNLYDVDGDGTVIGTFTLIVNGLHKSIDGNVYYYENGEPIKGGIREINGTKYIFDKDGKQITDSGITVVTIDGVDKDVLIIGGALAEAGKQENPKTGEAYFIGENGVILSGWQTDKDGKTYYADPDNKNVLVDDVATAPDKTSGVKGQYFFKGYVLQKAAAGYQVQDVTKEAKDVYYDENGKVITGAVVKLKVGSNDEYYLINAASEKAFSGTPSTTAGYTEYNLVTVDNGTTYYVVSNATKQVLRTSPEGGLDFVNTSGVTENWTIDATTFQANSKAYTYKLAGWEWFDNGTTGTGRAYTKATATFTSTDGGKDRTLDATVENGGLVATTDSKTGKIRYDATVTLRNFLEGGKVVASKEFTTHKIIDSKGKDANGTSEQYTDTPTPITDGTATGELAMKGYLEEVTYTGKAITFPNLVVYDTADESTPLIAGKDYTISYKDNKNAGQGKIVVKGKGNYDQEIVQVFNINPVEISAENGFTVEDVNVLIASGSSKSQYKEQKLRWNGSALAAKNNYGYTKSTEDGAYVQAGNWPVTITGTGNFTGSIEYNVNIGIKGSQTLMSKTAVAYDKTKAVIGSDFTFDKDALLATVTVKQGKNAVSDTLYTKDVVPGDKAGTAYIVITAIPDAEGQTFVGSKQQKITIKGVNNGKMDKSWFTVKDVTYRVEGYDITNTDTEGAYGLGFAAKYGERTLEEDVDFTVASKNTNKAGKATFTFTGKGVFQGKASVTFKINPKALTDTDITLYDGDTEITENKLDVPFTQGGATVDNLVVKNGDTKLTLGTDYTVSYKDNKKVGTGTMTIKGKGNYKGQIAVTLTIKQRELTDGDNEYVSTQTTFKAFKENKTARYYFKAPVLVDNKTGKKLAVKKDYTLEANKFYKDNTGSEAFNDTDSIDVTGGDVYMYAKVTFGGTNSNYTSSELYVPAVRISNTAQQIKSGDFPGKKIGDQIYTGKAITFDDSMSDEAKSAAFGSMKLGEDFEILAYKNNIKKGKASVTIRGLGKYAGVATVNFYIKAKSIKKTATE